MKLIHFHEKVKKCCRFRNVILYIFLRSVFYSCDFTSLAQRQLPNRSKVAAGAENGSEICLLDLNLVPDVTYSDSQLKNSKQKSPYSRKPILNQSHPASEMAPYIWYIIHKKISRIIIAAVVIITTSSFVVIVIIGLNFYALVNRYKISCNVYI